MVNKFTGLINFKVLALLVLVISIVSSVLHYTWQPLPSDGGDYTYHYTHYNNYLIFKYSFYHLIHHQDLYKEYPGEFHYDLFKYSPAFALFMGAFAYMPDIIGLILWCTLNGLVLLYAMWKFPFLNVKYRLLAIGFIFIELITSIQNAQSNALIAGLLILAFLAAERKNIALATLLIISTAFIKLYGIAALLIFLFYPKKWKAALLSLAWIILFALIPLLIVSPTELIAIYKSWLNCLQNDYSASYGFSVMGWLYTWFGIHAKKATLVIGTIIFLIPLLRFNYFQAPLYRQFFFASLLIWIIIFNYKSESPTFIIAICGVALWYFIQPYSALNTLLLIIAFLFTVLSSTDIFPKFIRSNYFIPYVVKVVPCMLIWAKIIYDLLTYRFSKQDAVLS